MQVVHVGWQTTPTTSGISPHLNDDRTLEVGGIKSLHEHFLHVMSQTSVVPCNETTPTLETVRQGKKT